MYRYRNGQEVTGDSRITISRDKKRVEEYNLSVTLTKSEDGGEYEVRATNEMGTSVTKSYVTVHCMSLKHFSNRLFNHFLVFSVFSLLSFRKCHVSQDITYQLQSKQATHVSPD